MLKCCGKPLITLVLALVATGVLSTLSPARDLKSDNASAIRTSATAQRPNPVTNSGEPDTPQAPPPPSRLNTGVWMPSSIEGSDGGYFVVFRWTGWVWAYWFMRAAL